MGPLSVCTLGQGINLLLLPSPPLPHLFAVSVVFTVFSADALRGRIEDCRAETVLTVDQWVREGKTLELKSTVKEAMEGLAFVRHVFVMKRTGGSVPHTPRDVSLEEVGLG